MTDPNWRKLRRWLQREARLCEGISAEDVGALGMVAASSARQINLILAEMSRLTRQAKPAKKRSTR